jgi:hypothetical protein
MKINLELISKLEPCKDRLDNYVNFYGNKDFTPAQFMGLKNITQNDKMWVTMRLIPKDKLRLVAADIAETVLHIYESQYPNDSRPRKAIEAARSGDNNAYAASAALRLRRLPPPPQGMLDLNRRS